MDNKTIKYHLLSTTDICVWFVLLDCSLWQWLSVLVRSSSSCQLLQCNVTKVWFNSDKDMKCYETVSLGILSWLFPVLRWSSWHRDIAWHIMLPCHELCHKGGSFTWKQVCVTQLGFFYQSRMMFTRLWKLLK